jgi:hypothetical protein
MSPQKRENAKERKTDSLFLHAFSEDLSCPKNGGTLIDVGEWKEKTCMSIGTMRWSWEKGIMSMSAAIFMEMENDSEKGIMSMSAAIFMEMEDYISFLQLQPKVNRTKTVVFNKIIVSRKRRYRRKQTRWSRGFDHDADVQKWEFSKKNIFSICLFLPANQAHTHCKERKAILFSE